MDDPGLHSMYARAISQGAASLRRRGSLWLYARRGPLRWILAALTVFGLAFGYYAHLQGKFRRLKTELHTIREAPKSAGPLVVGGQEPLVLERSPLSDGSMPEFLSATLLPGRGMAVLQITASIPGRGVVSLLDGTSIEDAAQLLPDTEADPQGTATRRISAPIELPWAGTLPVPSHDQQTTPSLEWRGHPIDLPLTGPGNAISGGLLFRLGADSVEHNVMPDGGSVAAEFDTQDFDAKWPSQTHVTVTALLSNRAFDLRVTARNTGREPEPMGIGWAPRLVLPSGSRNAATLHLPADQQEEQSDMHATGRLLDVAGTPLDFTSRTGRRLGSSTVHETFVHLKTGFLDNGPVLELKDTESGTGFRMSALSQQIRAVRVDTGDQPASIRLGFQTNYDDPFSHVWTSDDSSGVVVVQPGQTVQWRVRLELFGLTSNPSAPL